MPANLENSAVATALEKASFHSSSKERQCQRMLKLPHNCIHLTCLYINAQNSPSQASTVHEPWTSRFQAGFRKGRGTRGQIDNIHCIIAKAKEFQKYIYLCFIDYAKTFDCVDQNKLQKILKEIEIPDHLICPLRNLYAGQEATVRTGHGKIDSFQIGKGMHQGCILSPCLFHLYAEYIMRNAGLDEAQTEIKTAGRNINNLIYANNTTFMEESEEELRSLLMKLKEESEKVGLKPNI